MVDRLLPGKGATLRCEMRGRKRSTMAKPVFLTTRGVSWRSVLTSLGASSMLVASALSPAALAAGPTQVAAPAPQVAAIARSAPKDVARKDTLVVSDFGPGLSEIQDPTNMNPYSLGGTGRVRAILNKTIFEFLYL